MNAEEPKRSRGGEMSTRYKVILSIKLSKAVIVYAEDSEEAAELAVEEAQNSDDAAFADDVDVIDVFEEEG